MSRLAILLTFLVAGTAAWAADPAVEKPAASTIVHVLVSGDDGPKQVLEECLAAELRKDPTLRVGDSQGALTLDVIVTVQKMSDGSMLGFLVYVGGYVPGFQCVEHPDSPSGVIVYQQTLRMFPPDLDAACRRIAGEYRTAFVAHVRQGVQESVERSFREMEERGRKNYREHQQSAK